jgi:hypothetical protein
MRTLSVLVGSLMAGVAVSSFRHYYHRFAEEQDRGLVDRREVVIVEDRTKTTRRKKK